MIQPVMATSAASHAAARADELRLDDGDVGNASAGTPVTKQWTAGAVHC